MIITIFGATGMVGRYLVKMALWQNHTVRAYGRNVHELLDDQERHPNLQLIKAGVFDKSDMDKAIKGADVVLSVLGGAFDGTDNTRSLGMKNIVEAMKKNGVKRVLGVGGLGVLNAADGKYIFEQEGFPQQYLPVTQEHFKAYEHLRDSGLDWTFVCPPDIHNEPTTGEYLLAADYPAGGQGKINAGDIADFMLKEMTAGNYVQKRVGMSN
jgi:uncharacterized protein